MLEKPIYPPAPDYEPLNYEIWTGHHRAAAAAVLALDEVEVLVLRAIKRRQATVGERTVEAIRGAKGQAAFPFDAYTPMAYI